MAKAHEVHKEMYDITTALLELGICDDQQYPVVRQVGHNRFEVTRERSSEYSSVFRKTDYADAYRVMKRNRDFNVSLADGGLLQVHYLLHGDEVLKHRLAFFPSPDFSAYQNEPELYENNVIYSEALERGVVATPIRFDFDKEAFEEDVHPVCHLTIGQYKNCRVPVASAISPFRFVEFVMGAFYNTAFRDFRSRLRDRGISFAPTITPAELQRLHLALPVRLT